MQCVACFATFLVVCLMVVSKTVPHPFAPGPGLGGTAGWGAGRHGPSHSCGCRQLISCDFIALFCLL